MLAITQIRDLFTEKLPDKMAREYLLELNNQQPSPDLINDLVTNIMDVTDSSTWQPLLQANVNQDNLIDCCGTGGSGINHFNTSTSIAFILATGEVPIAKFGNRSSSSLAGSFDFLEILNIPISLSPTQLAESLEKTNLAFLFAPQFYPVFTKLSPIRKTIAGRTVFNLIGPLLNPMSPKNRLLGTFSKDSQNAIANYLLSYTKNKRSFVVNAESSLDELDPSSNNSILEITNNAITEKILVAMQTAPIPTGLFTKVSDNARIFLEMIKDFASVHPYIQSLVTANAGAAFLLADKVNTLEAGQELAKELLQSGQVLAKYEQCRSLYAKYT